jgi:Polycystin cation channel
MQAPSFRLGPASFGSTLHEPSPESTLQAQTGAITALSSALGIKTTSEDDLVDCKSLVKNILQNQARERYSWTLPIALLGYALSLTVFLLHCRIDEAYSTETAIIGITGCSLSSPPPVTSYSNLYSYLSTTILPSYLPDTSGNIANYNLMLGGVLVSQSKSIATVCGLFPDLSIVQSGGINASTLTCDPFGVEFVSPFNVADPSSPLYDPTSPVYSAFIPNNLSSTTPTNTPYSIVFPYTNDLLMNQNLVQLLEQGNWFSSTTELVTITFGTVSLNGNTWAVSAQTLKFTRGGKVDWSCSVKSSPIDSYYQDEGLVALDIALLVYLSFVLMDLFFHLYKHISKTYYLAKKHHFQFHHFASSHFYQGILWLMLDLATGISLIIAVNRWLLFLAQAKFLRTYISTSLDWRNAIGTSLAGTTTVSALNAVSRTLAYFYSFKVVGIVSTILLTLRLFYTFSLQPKLSVILEAISRSMSDMIHFLVPWTIIAVGFGVWGHVIFGTQMQTYSTNDDSSFTQIKYLMYDYDYSSMQTVSPINAQIYYGLFMFLVTNLITWMFLAIPLEFYANVRMEVAEEASALSDIIEGIKRLPEKAKRMNVVNKLNQIQSTLLPNRSFSLKSTPISSYKVLDVLQSPPFDSAIERNEKITLGQLSSALNVSIDDMATFIDHYKSKTLTEQQRMAEIGANAAIDAVANAAAEAALATSSNIQRNKLYSKTTMKNLLKKQQSKSKQKETIVEEVYQERKEEKEEDGGEGEEGIRHRDEDVWEEEEKEEEEEENAPLGQDIPSKDHSTTSFVVPSLVQDSITTHGPSRTISHVAKYLNSSTFPQDGRDSSSTMEAATTAAAIALLPRLQDAIVTARAIRLGKK